VLRRHGHEGGEVVAGYNATYPTFVCGDVVVKLFGGFPLWRDAFAREDAALAAVAADPGIVAPRVLARGRLFDDAWPYLVLARVAGASRTHVAPDAALAAAVGAQVRRLHALPPGGVAPHELATPGEVADGARRSSLPAHLAEQVPDLIARVEPDAPVLVHADLCSMHVFTDGARLTGIIDWGDATVADRHYELIQIHRDLFDCDRALLRAFLDASDWPVPADFAVRALAFALHRQADGLAQHRGMDVFEPVAAKLPLDDIATLDELAAALFGV
jgi:aminoglycoside phosphotransferase (APT) family kinase protein